MNKSVQAARAASALVAMLLQPSTAILAKDSAPPPILPPPLTEAESHAGTPGILFSDVVRPTGRSDVAAQPIMSGGTLLSIPFAYRYTAVITEDVTGYSFTVGGVQAPAGSPGYYAGSFRQEGSYREPRDGVPMDMWCFLPRVAGGKRENICLLRNDPKRAAIAPKKANQYLWTSFSPMTGTFDYVNTPIFERRTIDLPIKPVLEYKFVKWSGDRASIDIQVFGKSVTKDTLTADDNGLIRLRTIGGDFIVSKDASNAAAARITSAGG